jgi:aspartokinase-like uncharacterized kinase
MSNQVVVRVVKLGGSLLGWADAADAVRRWLNLQPVACDVLVTGGGALADQVRAMDRLYHLEPATSHRLAVRAMGIHAQLCQALLPESRQLRLSDAGGTDANAGCYSPGDATALVRSHHLWVLDPVDFVERVDGAATGKRLPVGWHVTSDSIAARVAEVLAAAELVLLKSSLSSDNRSSPLVDEYFSTAAAQLPVVRAVNLRDPDFAESRLS